MRAAVDLMKSDGAQLCQRLQYVNSQVSCVKGYNTAQVRLVVSKVTICQQSGQLGQRLQYISSKISCVKSYNTSANFWFKVWISI